VIPHSEYILFTTCLATIKCDICSDIGLLFGTFRSTSHFLPSSRHFDYDQLASVRMPCSNLGVACHLLHEELPALFTNGVIHSRILSFNEASDLGMEVEENESSIHARFNIAVCSIS